MTLSSPYAGIAKAGWEKVTLELVDNFPIDMSSLVEVVHYCWEEIYATNFGSAKLVIGKDIFFPAQATGVLLEKLIAHRLNQLDATWRGGSTKYEKDIVNGEDSKFSFEIKTSSSKSGLYGNRSTGHKSDSRAKHRTGYYLVVNYKLPKDQDPSRKVLLIRFGWIDDEDWVGQKKPTGQQASIGAELSRKKLATIFPAA